MEHRDRILVTYPEAAEMLGVGRSTLYELTAAGEIPVVRIGRAARIPVAALRRYAERLEQAS